MAIGFLLGVVIIIHQAGMVNYFCHKYGTRRYQTNDHSTNNGLVAVLSIGEGWHNNHHRHPTSARAGLFWWELDLVYYLICLLEKLGIIWDARRPPRSVYPNGATSCHIENNEAAISLNHHSEVR